MEKENYLKHIYSRELRNGDWVILADKSDPLIVDKALVKQLTQCNNLLDDDTTNILKESGFFTNSISDTRLLPDEKSGWKWNLLRYGLITIGVISFVLELIMIPFIGVPIGSKIISNEVPLWITIIFVLVFSIITTLLHELMHMIYARTFSYRANSLNLRLKKATAVVSMTHIWVWSFLPRFTALAAGIIFDLLLLTCLSCAQLFFDNWMLIAASSVLWLRILWQLQFNQTCDGQLIAMTILDNPMIVIDAQNSDFKNRNIRIWRSLKVISYIITLLLMVFWLMPFISSVICYIKSAYAI